MIRSRLSLKLFAAIVPVIVLFALAIYGFSVPLIKRTVFELEEHAGRAVLDTVFELANRIHLNLESYREQVLAAHETRLKNILEIVASYIDSLAASVQAGELSQQSARGKLYETLRRFHYGSNDYLWIADYDGVLLSHPDPTLNGRTAPEQDENGEPVIAKMVAIARIQGEGFFNYRWRRLGDRRAIPKLSYFKDFPEWRFVVGTGVYLDDVQQDLERRKVLAVQELRSAVRDIKIGRTGYLYIFDSDYRMVIHPNPNIEGSYFGELVDPISRQPIGAELVRVADTPAGRFYKWDRPNDPGHYVYDKISWVRHFKGFDWYIASSVYVSELKESSEALGHRILVISISFLVLAMLLSYLFVRRITGPIKRLAGTAQRVQRGDLSARSGIVGDDEIGILSTAFDSMVVQLQDNIDNLDASVRAKTAELQESNRKLTQTVAKLEGTRRDLVKAERRQRLILDAIPAHVAQLDPQHRVQFVNQHYADLFQTDKQALLGRSLPQLAGWEQEPDTMRQLAQAQTGRAVTFTGSWRNATGKEVILKTTLMPEDGASQGKADVFVLALDVTEEKAAEQRLLAVQRMNAVAQLAAGLAHDFNNLLSIIIGNLSSAEERYADVAGIGEYLEPAIRASRRGADIMGRLLAFARSQPLQPRLIDAAQLLHSTMALLKRSLPGNIAMELQYDSGPSWIFADPVQLENAIVNLALNAKDAMPEGGTLRLALASRCLADSPETLSPLEPGEYVEIQVSDSGQGFTSDALKQAFEPFFTTKKSGAGSGLGLSMVFGFVKQSGGHIAIDSAPGQGATVTILLPAASTEHLQATDEPLGAPSSAAEWSGKLAIVVEDESEVRDIVRRQLVDLGFAVIECMNAEEALQLLEVVEDLYLVLSDIVMPGALNGFDLADRVLTSQPQVRILLMTGFVADEGLAAGNPRRLTILRKPFDKRTLCNAIARSVSAAPTPNGILP